MSNSASTEPKKRKRASDNSSKNEPVAKKARRNNKSIKLEKDNSIETCGTRSKSNKDTRRRNPSRKSQSYIKSEITDYEINNNIPSDNETSIKAVKKEVFELSSKIINSEAFKKLRDLRVLLDTSVVDNYLRKKSKKSNPPKKSRKRGRPSRQVKEMVGTENHGQKTLFHFFDVNTASGQSPAIDSKPVLSIKCESIGVSKKSNQVKLMEDARVSISVKDLLMLCNVKVDLQRLQPIDYIPTEQTSISPTTTTHDLYNYTISSNENQHFDYYTPADWTGTPDDVSIDESLARIKIEDVSPSIDEHSMKMEVSDESLGIGEMNCTWNEDHQPCFEAFELERMTKMKLANALSALGDDRLLVFYDECGDVPMEEVHEQVTVKQEIGQSAPEPFVNFVNSTNNTSGFNLSRHSWPVSDESGIFMSDDSANFNEPSSKLMVNASFDGLGNEVNSIMGNT